MTNSPIISEKTDFWLRMPGPAASATSVGAGSPRGGGGSSPRAGLCKQLEVWQSRRADCEPSQEEEELGSVQGRLPPRVVALWGPVAPAVAVCGGSTQMTVLESRFMLSTSLFSFAKRQLLFFWHQHRLDPDLFKTVPFQVGPVPVLVMSLLFIACVFMLHIWGKYNRA